MISLRMAARNISRRKSRNILTVFAIVLGTALLVGVNIATTSAMAEFQRYLNRFWGETDLFIRYVGNAPFDEGNVTTVREASEMIKNVTARVGSWFRPGQSMVFINNDAKKMVGIVGITEDDFEYATYNITGSRTVNGLNVVIGSKLAEKYGVKTGDALRITVKTESETKNYTLKTIGIYYPTPPTTSIDIFMDFEKAQELTGLEGKVSLILVKVEDPAKVMETRELLQDRLGVEFEVLAPKIEAQQRIQSQLAGFQLGLNIMIMVALLVCGFLVFNTMFMAVKERTYEIGVLRAVGTSRRHIFLVFLEESLLLGVVGTFIGILAGLALSNLFALVLEQAFHMTEITGLTLTQDAVVIGLVGGLLTVVGGAVYPAVSASRVNILHALRPEMRVKRRIPDSILLIAGLLLFFFGAALALDMLPFSLPYVDMFLIPLGLVMFAAISVKKASKALVNPIMILTSSIGLLLSKSVTKKLLRNAVSFGMIGISLAFTIMMGGIQAGITDAVESGVKEALGADIMLVSNQTLPLSFKDDLISLEPERIQSVTPMSAYWAGTRVFNGENQSSVGVIVIEPETFYDIIRYQFVDSPQPEEVFSKLSSDNETLILPEGLADKLDVSVGSNLTVVTPMYGPKNFTVEGIFTGAALQFISFGYRPMSESIIISFKSESAYFYGRSEAIIFFVNLKDDFKQQASGVVESINSAYPQYNFGEHSTTLQDLLATVRTQVNQIFSIFHLMLYFAIFISTIGIAIIMIMNVTERRREMGLLRSQGMSRTQILSMLLTEACFMGIIGFLVGLPSGLLLLKSATSTTTITGFWLPYIVPWFTIAQAFVFAIVASLAGALYPALKASRMSVTRALQQR
ncbi:MAG: FtsX-like permease family protein [Candidatus Bathyarchaeia archaeon]